MGTRGAYGFYKNGIDKITYNHFDSYFSGLGREIVDFVKKNNIEILNKIFDKIILVEENGKPTKSQIAECYRYANLSVGEQTFTDWYCLLRETQGNLEYYKDDLKYMIDYKEFMGNSLFCEYAYIINLDTNMLEIYVGFQKEEQKGNRYNKYKEYSDNDYEAVRLIKEFPLNNIPDNWEQILDKLDKR